MKQPWQTIPAISLTIIALALPAQADLRSSWEQQQKIKAQQNSCTNFDKAQWIGLWAWSNGKKLAHNRIFIRPDGALLDVEEDFNYRLQQGRHLVLDEPVPRTCRVKEGVRHTGGRKLGFDRFFFSDGSGSSTQTVVEGDYLVVYYSYCRKWKCASEVKREVVGVRIGSPSHNEALAAPQY